MSEYNVRLSNNNNYKVTAVVGGIQVPANFEDLLNFDYTDKNDQYVIMYDAVTQKYKLVNPDKVLNAAASTETTQPGLVGFATAFLDRVDVDLDNRIDLDGGEF
jgi:hypothetical protein